MSASLGVGDVLSWLGASGIAGTVSQPPGRPLDADSWSRLLDLSQRHGLSGLLVTAVESGSLPTTAEQREQAAQRHHDALVTTLAAERLIVRAADALDSTEIPLRILGGPTLAHLDYADPSLRPFSAVRLLVRTTEGPRVALALGALRREAGGAGLRWQTSIAPGQRSTSQRYEALWPDDWTELRLGGRTVVAAPAVLRLVDACLAAEAGGGDHRLIRDRDIAQVLLTGDVDTEDVVRLAAAWRCETEVAEAIDRAWARLRLVDALRITAWAKRYIHGAARRERGLPLRQRLARRA